MQANGGVVRTLGNATKRDSHLDAVVRKEDFAFVLEITTTNDVVFGEFSPIRCAGTGTAENTAVIAVVLAQAHCKIQKEKESRIKRTKRNLKGHTPYVDSSHPGWL